MKRQIALKIRHYYYYALYNLIDCLAFECIFNLKCFHKVLTHRVIYTTDVVQDDLHKRRCFV